MTTQETKQIKIIKLTIKEVVTTNKYRGKYRVVCEFSIDTLEPIKESTYIFCANGGEIYTTVLFCFS